MRGKQIVLTIVLLCATCGVAWAGKAAYKLVMSKDEKLCTKMLTLFNADMKKYGGLEYEKHKEFVVWDSVETGAGSSQDKYCRQTLKQNFDINNDGTDELGIRTRHCYKDQLTDRLYIFPLNSNAVELLKDPSSQVLGTTRDMVELSEYPLTKMPGAKAGELLPGIGPILTFEPFKVGQTFYISMTDLRQALIVIAKYLRGEELDNICYFRGKPLI